MLTTSLQAEKFEHALEVNWHYRNPVEAHSTDVNVERRAAIDWGSGSIKIQIADVNVLTNEVVKWFASGQMKLRLCDDLAMNGGERLSEEICDLSVEAVKRVMQHTADYQPESYRGAATAVFRDAINAQDLLDRVYRECGVHIKIISQDYEGYLGFLVALIYSPSDPETKVSWDNGGGSFQLASLDSRGEVETYQGPIGYTVAQKTLIEEIRGQDYVSGMDSYPITLEEDSNY